MVLRFKSPQQGERRVFRPQPLTREFMQERKNQSGSNRDRYLIPGIKTFSSEKDENIVRIIPAGWEGGVYGHEFWWHTQIGANNDTYLCSAMVKKGPCYVCEERKRAEEGGEDDDYLRSLNAVKRIGLYLINRAKEGEGPLFWAMPYGTEQEMASQAVHPRTQKVLQFIDPEEGYDLFFTRKGEKRNTKYTGLKFDHDSSPLSKDEDTMKEWLGYVQEHPIPDILIYRPYEYVKSVFEGKIGSGEDREDQPTGKLRIGGEKKKSSLNIRNRS